MTERGRHPARWTGPAAAALAWAAILVATSVAPTFSWTGSALSDLGTRSSSALVFNGGMAAAGLLAVPFAWWLWTTAIGVLHLAGAAVLAVALLGLAGVGAFPAGHSLHVPAALTFFLGFTLALLVHGAGSLRSGARRRGLFAVGLATGHLLAWVAWVLAGVEGLALPEAAGALALGIWTVQTARAGPPDRD